MAISQPITNDYFPLWNPIDGISLGKYKCSLVIDTKLPKHVVEVKMNGKLVGKIILGGNKNEF